jgi:choline dehydrogenase-like flavoprotein
MADAHRGPARQDLAASFDYLIVGAGSAGCVVARRLVESTDATVLVLEAGGTDKGVTSIAHPPLWTENLGSPYDWSYTCAMGAGPEAVVDAGLRVHGVEGLRIADASIMPTITSANTNAPCVMIGEFAARRIVGGLAAANGFRLTRVVPTGGGDISVIEGVPA